MATARKAAAKKPGPVEGEQVGEVPAFVDEVHERGGWAVGYVGDRVDDADDESYTVSGVLKPVRDETGDE
ncbi:MULTISPECIES: hypothetical protein [unclassified Streptomyces]|uniref:hypothetical protein n=1 Tax=unclassified Streptomyces TaxID=2593676 RepID=UPI000DD6DE22|nr:MULTISPECIES: hypothetical protein [unclassified Streptomyces]QZZ26525.1 hypothetical protein A7X85_09895 [Streptomyces sp. ST1015]